MRKIPQIILLAVLVLYVFDFVFIEIVNMAAVVGIVFCMDKIDNA